MNSSQTTCHITLLGTGSSYGVPVVACSCPVCCSTDPRDSRLRSALHLWSKGKSILIDAGPDLRQQVLREKISRLDAIIFTHAHRDHTAGLDEIRGFMAHQTAIALYGSAQVMQQLQQDYAYLFQKLQQQKTPRFNLYTLENKRFFIDTLSFLPIEVYHKDTAILGFRCEDVTYITDASFIAEAEIEKIKGTTILIINALQKKPNTAHFHLEAALTVAQKVQAKTTYLTHISHNLGLFRDIAALLPHSVQLAYDGLQIVQ